MTKLYEIATQIAELQELDIDEQTLADTLESMGMDVREKATNIIKMTQNIGGDIAAIDAEIKRLQDRKRVMNNRVESVKAYLRENMQRADITKISCPEFSITLKKPVAQVVIDDDSQIPDDYVTVKTEIKPDKMKIKKALKEGADIPGARLEDGKPSLMIK